VADSALLTAWLQAHRAGDRQLEAMLSGGSPPLRRRVPGLAGDRPVHGSGCAAGARGHARVFEPSITKAAELNAQASRYFDAGTEARETANKYVRLTVLFASVLFFVAVAQRFRLRGVRVGANAIALVLLAYTVYGVGSLPRI